jgi:hypothetical protein
MTRTNLLVLLILCLSLMNAGCVRHAPKAGVNYVIGPECKATAKLYGCTGSQSPPSCKSITLKYNRNCEQISLGH